MRLFRQSANTNSLRPSSAPPRVKLSDIELALEEVLIRGLPGDEEEADKVLGHSAQEMQKTLAWKTIYNNILRLRESFVQKLIAGEEGAAENRKAIVVMDSILKMPTYLAERGKQRES